MGAGFFKSVDGHFFGNDPCASASFHGRHSRRRAIWIGLVEGIGEGTALIAKVFSGVVADRFGHKKRLVFAGYFLGVVSKPVFALAGCMPVVLAARFFDRIGKGLRGAPRDAIVADVTDESIRGAAYGLRQSLDAAGAFVGPLIATLLLLLWTEDLRSIFWIALIPGAACLLLILIGVEDNVTETKSTKRIEWNEIGSVMTPAFRQLVILGTLFSLARFSNAFIVLKAADIGIDQAWIPMIIVLMNIAFSLSSYPFGMLADRLNPMRLLALGMVLLALSDLLFAFAANTAVLILGVVLFGMPLKESSPLSFPKWQFRICARLPLAYSTFSRVSLCWFQALLRAACGSCSVRSTALPAGWSLPS
jgi:MFS family permease